MRKSYFFLMITITSLVLITGCTSPNQPSPEYPTTTLPLNKQLDLSNQELTDVPEYVFNQKNIETINLSNNKLTGALGAEIKNLTNLKQLNLSNNNFSGVPAEVGQLQNLEVLDLSNNQLTGLPYEIGNLQNLKTLNVSGNNYSEKDLDIITEMLPANVTVIK